jgi:DNA helicase II / ATP-dependent DNA helicase PcrA
LEELLQNLNNNQKEAVLYNTGPSLVIAGAGSGKTRVLTHKIACLIREGFQPWSILALTFTNKAAKEMKERIASLINPESASRLWMGTFHSIFFRILRNEAEAIGYPSGFTIYDTSDSKSLIKTIIKEMGLDDKIYKVGAVQGRISAAKNDLISVEAYASNSDWVKQDILSKKPLIKEIYRRYVERCRMANAMDFDDLLFNTNILFRDFPQILATYQERFQFILVDEYQDTNFSQYLIVKKLAERHHRVCVVGDDSQSIYSFRGANIENILNFKNTYPEGKLFKLEQNYRSTKTIVNAANSLIEKNKGQIQKRVFSEQDQGSKIRVLTAYSDLEEGFIVSNKIAEMRLNHLASFNDFVILYRTNAQSRIFEEALRKRNLPYRVYGGLSFYQRKEIKDVIAYLRLLLNTSDEEAFKRIVNVPARGIGDTTVQKLIHASTENYVSLWEVLCNLETYQVPIHSGTVKKLEAFRNILLSLKDDAAKLNVYELTRKLLTVSGIDHEIQADTSPESLSRKENVQALLAGMYEFVENRKEEGNENHFVWDYLQEVSLLTDQDDAKNSEGERITLMTIHAAKGLEFSFVFVVGLEEDIFPSSHSLDSERSLEEERRLLYVAITRARLACVLSYAKSRFRNGQNNFTRPSRFLKDLDSTLLDYPTEGSLFGGSGSSSVFERESPVEYGSSGNDRLNRSFSTPSASDPGRPSTPRLSLRNNISGKTITPPSLSNTSKKLTRLDQVSASQPNLSGTPSTHTESGLRQGSIIAHERFGVGSVKSIEGTGDNAKIEVEFENAGYRKLLLKFARFSVIKP